MQKQFIQHILNQTPEQYEHHLLDTFMVWCELHSVSNKDLQQLIINQQLYNWYLTQINLLEGEFIEKVSNSKTIKMTIDKLNDKYIEVVERIGLIYPKQLLLSIRKKARAERINNAYTLEYYNKKEFNLN